MALRKIVYAGEDILRKTSKDVKVFDESLHTLLDDMRDTMNKNYGCGLAGPQVNVLKRVVVIDVNNMQLELINPVITSSCGSQYGVEGCLSVKNIRGYVTRPMTITVKAQDRFGHFFEITGEEMLSRTLCHEIDHLNGILFTDKMEEEYSPKKDKRK